MDHCHFCATAGGKHQAGCPNEYEGTRQADADVRKDRAEKWERGRNAGIDGEELSATESAAYHLGWLNGDRRADEIANGEYDRP